MKFQSLYKNLIVDHIHFRDGIYETIDKEEIEKLSKLDYVSEFKENQEELEKLKKEKAEIEAKVSVEVDKITNRILELIQLNKDQQIDLITSLKGTDDGRGSVVDRIKKILELEKGV